MMWRSPEPRFDVASAICQGGRDYQEDAIASDFPAGADSGLVVLADGMGGHAAGDVASKIVVTEVFSDLKFMSANFSSLESEIPDYLKSATKNANECVSEHVNDHPLTHGMGSTLVAMVMVQNRMYWMSVGDSPMYLFRKGKLRQLNEDHSMAPQVDYMVAQGLLDAEAGRNHPDRDCLTSVIIGSEIARADCPSKPFSLEVGDIILISSDGLQYLEEQNIEKLLRKYRRRKSSEIAEQLLEAVHKLADPDQDNVSFAVIKLNHNKPVERVIRPKPVSDAQDDINALGTRVVKLNDEAPNDSVLDAKKAAHSEKDNGIKDAEIEPKIAVGGN